MISIQVSNLSPDNRLPVQPLQWNLRDVTEGFPRREVRKMADENDNKNIENTGKICCLYRIGEREKDPGCEIIYLEDTNTVCSLPLVLNNLSKQCQIDRMQ